MNPSLRSPDEIRQQIWKELVRATRDRHHAWRTPVLATAMSGGLVNARTVVLRKASMAGAGGTLEIYSDGRSGKVSDLIAQPNACLVFWSPRLSWQLRVRVDISVQTDGPYVQALWQSVRQTRAAGDYMGLMAPGMLLPPDQHAEDFADVDDDTQQGHFAVLTAKVVEIDWLELGQTSHRRARVRDNQWQWLMP